MDFSLLQIQFLLPSPHSLPPKSLPHHFSPSVTYFYCFNVFLHFFFIFSDIYYCTFFSIDGVGSKRFRWVLSDELPRLAKELNRLQSIRTYLGQFSAFFFNLFSLFLDFLEILPKLDKVINGQINYLAVEQTDLRPVNYNKLEAYP